MSPETLSNSPWMKAFIALLVLLGIADFFLDYDGHATWFYIVMAAAGSTGLLVLAKIVQGLLQRPKEYYND